MVTRELLSRADFQRDYGPRKSTFYHLLNRGELKAVKIGRRTFVRRQDAENWAERLKRYEPRGS